MKEPTKKQIESATKSWDGIDTQEFMDEIRRDNIHTIDLTDEQARSAAEGTLTEIRVEIEGLPQAPIIDVYESAFAGIRFFCVDYVGGLDRIDTPYAIGDTINCREAWTYGNQIGGTYQQIVRKSELIGGSHLLLWNNAETIPDEAILHGFTVQSVGAEQEGEKWYWVLGVK